MWWTDLVLVEESFKLVLSLVLRLARHALDGSTETGFTETELLHGEGEEGLCLAPGVAIIGLGRVAAVKCMLSPVVLVAHLCGWAGSKNLAGNLTAAAERSYSEGVFSRCVARCS